jgi:uncharacterized protein (DUF1778 family)
VVEMARQIQSIIELNKEQTKQFLDSLQHPKNEKNRREAIKKAKKMKFNLIL